jgi:hypothetical protein
MVLRGRPALLVMRSLDTALLPPVVIGVKYDVNVVFEVHVKSTEAATRNRGSTRSNPPRSPRPVNALSLPGTCHKSSVPLAFGMAQHMHFAPYQGLLWVFCARKMALERMGFFLEEGANGHRLRLLRADRSRSAEDP